MYSSLVTAFGELPDREFEALELYTITDRSRETLGYFLYRRKMKKIKIPPSLALWIVAPIFGELFSGSSPLNEYINPVTFLTLGLLYGSGAIICRELVIRWNKGWVSLLLLGFAYGIYEEGLLVQSFFDPGWMDLGVLATYGRVAGVNWVWTEHLTIFHALISILASVAFVEILYPQRRRESWVHRFWWVVNWIGFIGIYVVWAVMTTYDPGLWRIVSVLTIATLVLLGQGHSQTSRA